METRIIDYTVRVIGAEQNGHPVQSITHSFNDAGRLHDEYRKKYPQREITISQTEERMIVRTVPEKPKRQPAEEVLCCPKGHTGTTDGKSIITMGLTGKLYCSVCGEFFQPPLIVPEQS